MGIDTGRYRVVAGSGATFEDIDLDEEDVRVGGKRYTEADTERDSDAMAARHRGLSRGGHSLSGDGSHSPTVAT